MSICLQEKFCQRKKLSPGYCPNFTGFLLCWRFLAQNLSILITSSGWLLQAMIKVWWHSGKEGKVGEITWSWQMHRLRWGLRERQMSVHSDKIGNVQYWNLPIWVVVVYHNSQRPLLQIWQNWVFWTGGNFRSLAFLGNTDKSGS